MYLKHLILITFFTTGLLFAQTGPGGVGNSSTNSLWLIGDDISQVDGTPIPSWLDRSGNGNDATQGTPGYQPRYDSLIVNGHSVVDLTEQMTILMMLEHIMLEHILVYTTLDLEFSKLQIWDKYGEVILKVGMLVWMLEVVVEHGVLMG